MSETTNNTQLLTELNDNNFDDGRTNEHDMLILKTLNSSKQNIWPVAKELLVISC